MAPAALVAEQRMPSGARRSSQVVTTVSWTPAVNIIRRTPQGFEYGTTLVDRRQGLKFFSAVRPSCDPATIRRLQAQPALKRSTNIQAFSER